MERIGKGRTAEVYDYKDNTVLKLFYPAFSSHDVEDEYHITKDIYEISSIVPKVYDVVHVKNRIGIVYEKIKGILMSDYLLRNYKNIRRVIGEFAGTQKKINSLNLENFTKHEDRLRSKINRSILIDGFEKKIVLRYLQMINRNEICHGDYHPENVFIDQDNNIKVIDWANMVVSNKYIDIARTYYLINSGTSLIKKSMLGRLIEWLGRRYITSLYWKEMESEEIRNKYFLPCLFIIILVRYDENIEQEKKWIFNYVMKNKKRVLGDM